MSSSKQVIQTTQLMACLRSVLLGAFLWRAPPDTCFQALLELSVETPTSDSLLRTFGLRRLLLPTSAMRRCSIATSNTPPARQLASLISLTSACDLAVCLVSAPPPSRWCDVCSLTAPSATARARSVAMSIAWTRDVLVLVNASCPGCEELSESVQAQRPTDQGLG